MSNSAALATAVAPVADATRVDITRTIPVTTSAKVVPSWYAIKRDSDEAEVSIYEEIGGWGITAKRFVDDLKEIDAKTIHVRLNTYGGEVFDGTAIHNALVEHPAKIIVHVDGVAASAGSFIAMSGDEIRMADNAWMMIHNAWGGVMGDADAMHRYADMLEKMNDVIAGMYERKSGKNREHWRGLMDDETWFTAAEAKEHGLADVVEPPTKKTATDVAAAASKTRKAQLYNKIPDPVRQMWGIDNNTSDTPPAAPLETTTAPGNQNQSTPEASLRSDPVPATFTKDSPMSEATVPAVPATNAAAVTPVDSVPTVAAYEAITATNHHTRGVADGRAAERQAQMTLMRELVAACPGKPELAINAFLSEPQQTAANVKLAFDAAKAAEQAAAAQIEAMRLETARQVALASAGGYPGGVATGTKGEDELSFAPNTPPETQAKMEWDGNYKNCRNSGATETQYLAMRVRQLAGVVRTFSK